MGFEAAHTFAIILRGSEVPFLFPVGEGPIRFRPGYLAAAGPSSATRSIPRSPKYEIRRADWLRLPGSKVGTMLARSGVARFFLADDDILFPDNFVRNDLDWRDVGSHKANALLR